MGRPGPITLRGKRAHAIRAMLLSNATGGSNHSTCAVQAAVWHWDVEPRPWNALLWRLACGHWRHCFTLNATCATTPIRAAEQARARLGSAGGQQSTVNCVTTFSRHCAYLYLSALHTAREHVHGTSQATSAAAPCHPHGLSYFLLVLDPFAVVAALVRLRLGGGCLPSLPSCSPCTRPSEPATARLV